MKLNKLRERNGEFPSRANRESHTSLPGGRFVDSRYVPGTLAGVLVAVSVCLGQIWGLLAWGTCPFLAAPYGTSGTGSLGSSLSPHPSDCPHHTEYSSVISVALISQLPSRRLLNGQVCKSCAPNRPPTRARHQHQVQPSAVFRLQPRGDVRA